MKESIIYEEKLKNANMQLESLYEEIKKNHEKVIFGNFEEKEWKNEKNKIYTNITAYEKTIEETKKSVNIAKGISGIDETIINKVETNLRDEEIIKIKIQQMKEMLKNLDKKFNLLKKEPEIEYDIMKYSAESEAKKTLDLMNERLEDMKKMEKIHNDLLDKIEDNVENSIENKMDNANIKNADAKDLSNKKQENKKKKNCIII